VRLEFGDFAAPTVTDVSISPAPPLGEVTAQFEITFSEEMYRFLTPTVQMGTAPPYDTYTLSPLAGNDYTNGFLNSDPTRWRGTFTFAVGMPNGTYHLSVGGARDTWHNTLSIDTSYTFEVEISASGGPTFGTPIFSNSVMYDKSTTVEVEISDAATGANGVAQATLYYGYTNPYNQHSVSGSSPGGIGDGTWTFVLPAQGWSNVNQTLRFYIQAWDGDSPQSSAVLNNNGINYAVLIHAHRIYVPLVLKGH
jgi:hypothetical protein